MHLITKSFCYSLGNVLLHITHLFVILFSLLGWILPQTRPWHLILQALISFSWFGLGSKKGWGYCLITDLQWKLKRSMNISMGSNSYIKWLIDKLFSTNISEPTANLITMVTFFLTTFLSLYLYF